MIYKKVENVWEKILKPPGTENIKLDDLFHLNTFFRLHSSKKRRNLGRNFPK